MTIACCTDYRTVAYSPPRTSNNIVCLAGCVDRSSNEQTCKQPRLGRALTQTCCSYHAVLLRRVPVRFLPLPHVIDDLFRPLVCRAVSVRVHLAIRSHQDGICSPWSPFRVVKSVLLGSGSTCAAA